MGKEDLTPWFDPKFRINRTSKVIPVLKKSYKKEQEIQQLKIEKLDLEDTENVCNTSKQSETIKEEMNIIEKDHNFKSKSEYNAIISQEESSLEKSKEEGIQESDLEAMGLNTINIAYIRGVLEKIIFDDTELFSLKNTINDIIEGNHRADQLKKHILNSYIRIFEDIVKFIPHYLIRESKKAKHYSPTLVADLNEKDILLQELGQRINNIYLKLKEEKEELLDEPIERGTKDAIFQPHIEKTKEINKETSLDTPKDKFIYIDNKSYRAEDCYFVIDGANVALEIKTSDNKGKLSNLKLLVNKLLSLGIKNYKILCDKALRHKIDEVVVYKNHVKNNEIIETPARAQADKFFLPYAYDKDAYIISNDQFTDFYDIYGEEWIREKRISFTFIDDTIYFDRLMPPG